MLNFCRAILNDVIEENIYKRRREAIYIFEKYNIAKDIDHERSLLQEQRREAESNGDSELLHDILDRDLLLWNKRFDRKQEFIENYVKRYKNILWK